ALTHACSLRTARRFWRRRALADTTGRELRFGAALTASLLLARRFRAKETMVGVMLPASVAGALVNLALMFAGRTPVNLNFTAGREAMEQAIRRCGITTVVTSRTFLAKAKLEAPAIGNSGEIVHVEDLLKGIGRGEKLAFWLAARLAPAG